MAWMYSHMISGRSGVARVAHATRSSTAGYIGTIRSDSGVARARSSPISGMVPVASSVKTASPMLLSYWIGRVGSQARSHVAAACRIGALPLSLPSDHTITDGWFLSRWAIRVMRSSTAPPTAGP